MRGPSTPNSVERSASALHAARRQRDEGETTVEQISERLQQVPNVSFSLGTLGPAAGPADVASTQALREGAERLLEMRRIGEAKARLEEAHAVCIRRLEVSGGKTTVPGRAINCVCVRTDQ